MHEELLLSHIAFLHSKMKQMNTYTTHKLKAASIDLVSGKCMQCQGEELL